MNISSFYAIHGVNDTVNMFFTVVVPFTFFYHDIYSRRDKFNDGEN